MNHAGDRTLLRFTDKKMNVLGHHNITGDRKPVAPLHALQRLLEKIARRRRAKVLDAPITTEGEEVKTTRMFVTDKSARHRSKAYIESLPMWRESKNR